MGKIKQTEIAIKREAVRIFKKESKISLVLKLFILFLRKTNIKINWKTTLMETARGKPNTEMSFIENKEKAFIKSSLNPASKQDWGDVNIWVRKKLKAILIITEAIAIKVGVFVSFKEKNARKSNGIRAEAERPRQNKAKLEEVKRADPDENWPCLKIIPTISFLKIKIKILVGIIK